MANGCRLVSSAPHSLHISIFGLQPSLPQASSLGSSGQIGQIEEGDEDEDDDEEKKKKREEDEKKPIIDHRESQLGKVEEEEEEEGGEAWDSKLTFILATIG